MKPFEYARPVTVAEAARSLGRGGAAIAGGTDLLGLMKGGITAPERLVDLTRIEGLRGWTRERGAGLRIGALTPLADIEESDQLGRWLPAAREAVASAATLQLRTSRSSSGPRLPEGR